MSKRLSQNTLILLISNVGSAVLSFVLIVMIGRHYGDSGLGIYAGILAWITPLSFLIDFGFSTLITRDIARNPSLTALYLKLTWQFRIVVGGILLMITLVIAPVLVAYPEGLILSSPLIIILPAYSTYTAIFRANQRMLPIAWLNIGMLIAQVIFTAVAIQLQADIIWLFIINTATSLLQCGFAWWVYRRAYQYPAKTSSTITLRQLINQSRPFAFAAILSAIQSRFAIVYLETISTPATVGLFVSALRFIEGARIIPNAFFGAVFPALSVLIDNRSALNRLLGRIVITVGLYGMIVAVILQLYGEQILWVTFGEQFLGASSALYILGLALIPFVLRSAWSLYWYAIGREQAVNIILLINLLILILLSVTLWLLTPSNPMGTITHAILYTETLTFALMFGSELARWKTKNTSSIA